MLEIDTFENYLYEEELSSNTVRAYIRGLKMFEELYGDEITKDNLIKFKKHLMSLYKPQTINLRLTAMRKYCDYKNINMKIKAVKEPKKTHIDNIITEEQFNKLINGLKADGQERYYVWVMLLAKTGMRISEAIKVKKKDVLNGSVVMNTKSHMREIYFPRSLVEDIKPFLDKIDDDDYVMQNVKGKAIYRETCGSFLKKWADRYGIPKEVMHPHAFRHYFAMEFIKRKNDIALLADVLGHGSVNVTQIYLRQSKEQQKQVVDEVVDW